MILNFWKKIRQFFEYSAIFIIIMGWIFSGWPPINSDFYLPPKLEKVSAAAEPGDFLIMRNDARTDSVTNTGNLDALWDTEVDYNSTSITYSAGTFTLAAGKYIVMYSERFHADDPNDNQRNEIQGRLVINGVATSTAAGQAYMRKEDGSSGDWQDDGIVHGAGIIQIENNDTSLVTRFYRTDDASDAGDTTDRYPGWGGVTILALDDTWNYGRYVTDSDKACDTTESTWQDIVWDTNLEEDTGFSRSGADITISSAGRYIVTASVPIQGATNRSEHLMRITLNGSEVEGTEVSTYTRSSQSTQDGVLTYAGIIDVGAGDVLNLENIRTEGTNHDYLAGSNIQIVQLPVGNKTIIVEATSGEMNPSILTEFSWDTIAHIDTDAFTMDSATDSYFKVNQNGHYLLFATQKSNDANSRTYASGRFSVNDVILPYAAGAEYGRNSGTADQPGYSFGTLASGVAIDSDISLENIYLEDTPLSQNVNHGAISALLWSSVFDVVNPRTDQTHFRWRNDTTDLNTPGGWLAPEDSNGIDDLEIDTTYRLRVEVANVGGGVELAARTYELQYGLKNGTCAAVSNWTGIGDASDDFDMVDTSHITSDGQSTSALLGNSEDYTFSAGEGHDTSDTTGSIGPLTEDYYTEIEYSFKPTSLTTYGADYCFRVYDATADEVLDFYTLYPEATMGIGNSVFRATEYYITDYTNTTYALTLDQDLATNHFVLIRGSKTGDGGSYPDNDYVRVYQLPSGINGELGVSGASNIISLSRHVADYTWEGVVTVVECLQECDTNGFTLLDVVETSLGNTESSGTDTSGSSWSDINQVVLFGGFIGGGAEFDVDTGSTNYSNAVQTRLYPSSANTINWARESTESLLTATMTTFVVEWGSDWTVQRANVSGSNYGDGCDSTAEYNSGSISEIARDNTWVWGTGYATQNGIGDSFSGTNVTLGDGVNQYTNENQVSFCGEYTSTKNIDIYTMTHSSLAVDYRFKADGDSGEVDLPVTVDSATDGARLSWVYNTCAGSGSAHPRDRFWARYTNDNEVTLSRGYSGQNFTAWLQGINFVAIQATPTPAVSISLNTDGTVSLGTVALNSSQDTTASGINDIEVVSIDNGPADLDIRSTAFTEGGNTWTLAGSNGTDQIVWSYSSSTPWYNFATADTLYNFDQSVPEGNTRDLVLKIIMPLSTASFNQYSATVTIVASSP